MRIEKEVLEDKWGEFSDLAGFASSALQDGRFSVSIDDGRFECLFSGSTEKRLFVLLSGARDPSTQPLPKFDRWSWMDMFPGAVLCISDPTLFLDPDSLHIGWYVGTARHDWLQSMAELVSTVAAHLAISFDDIICYGSSAGGFAALTLAARLERATAVAINPQTDVTKYAVRFLKKFLTVSFDGRSPRALSGKERKRLSAIAAISESKDAKCLIVQNVQDEVHYENHYTPFCAEFDVPLNGGRDRTGRIQTVTFTSSAGHGPEPKALAPDIIANAVALSKEIRRSEDAGLDYTASIVAARMRPRIKARQIYLLGAKTGLPEREFSGVFEFSPAGRKDVPPVELSLPLDWNTDPFKDRNWCAQLHMWRLMDAHLQQHSKTLEPEWLQFPLAVIEDWHRFHYIDRQDSTFAWMDMMVGLRAMKIAYVFSQLAHDGGVIEAKWQRIFDDLLRDHVEFLLDHRNVAYSNHTFIDLHGAAALTQIIEPINADKIDAFIDPVLHKLLGLQFNQYGVHLENSPGYQPFGIGCVKRLRDSCWFDRFNLDNLISKAQKVVAWLSMPDGRIIPFGDTDGKPQQLEVKDTVFQGMRQVFNSSGYVVIRDDGNGRVADASMLAIMGAYNSRFHKQADDLSFIWFEGEDILCDAGKFAYKADPRRAYVQSTRAHNTVEIDGQNYGGDPVAHPEIVYGSALGAVAVHEWGYLIDGQVKHLKSGVKHLRFWAYSPGAWVLVIDRMAADAPHDFTQWFHFSPHLSDLVKESDSYHAALSNGKALCIRSVSSEPATSILEKGVTTPRLQGWISQAYGELVPNCALGYQTRGKNVLFATLLSLGDAKSTLALQDEKRLAMKVSLNGVTESFWFSVGEKSCNVRKT